MRSPQTKRRTEMALLNTLKVVASMTAQPRSAQQTRRSKLISKLQEQRALAEAALGGAAYRRMRWATVVNAEGEPVRTHREVRLKQWWSTSSSGSILFTVRYGAKPVAISGGMSTIEVDTLEQLPATIATVIRAVDGGELDGELANAAKARTPPKPARPVSKR